MDSEDELDALLKNCEDEVDAWPEKKSSTAAGTNAMETVATTSLIQDCKNMDTQVDFPDTPEVSDSELDDEKAGGKVKDTPNMNTDDNDEAPKATETRASLPPSPGSPEPAASQPAAASQPSAASRPSAAKKKPSFSAKRTVKTPVTKTVPKFGPVVLARPNKAGSELSVKKSDLKTKAVISKTPSQTSIQSASESETISASQSKSNASQRPGNASGAVADAQLTKENAQSVSQTESPDDGVATAEGAVERGTKSAPKKSTEKANTAIDSSTSTKAAKPSFAVKQRPPIASKPPAKGKGIPTPTVKDNKDKAPVKLTKKAELLKKREDKKIANAAKLEEKQKAKEQQEQKRLAKQKEKEEKAEKKALKQTLPQEKKKRLTKANTREEEVTANAGTGREDAQGAHLTNSDKELSPTVSAEGREHTPDDDNDRSDVHSVNSLQTIINNLKEFDDNLTASSDDLDLSQHFCMDSDVDDNAANSNTSDVYNLQLELDERSDRIVAHKSSSAGKHTRKQMKNKVKHKKEKRAEESISHSTDDTMPPMMSGLENNGDIWVECVKCNKWRRLNGFTDAGDVPSDWECSANSDPKRSSCAMAEENWKDMDKSYTFAPCDITLGSVVWARVNGYPWWPGLVDIDPHFGAFANFEDGSDDEDGNEVVDRTYEPIAYHVVFGFDHGPTRAWVDKTNIQMLHKNSKPTNLGSVKLAQKKQIRRAAAVACECLSHSIKDRLRKFGHNVSMNSRSRKRRKHGDDSLDGSVMKKLCSSLDSSIASGISNVEDEAESEAADGVEPDDLECPDSPEY